MTIDDPVPPLISSPSGPLADTSAWHSGTKAIAFGGTDVTGIRQAAIYRGTTRLAAKTAPGAAAGGCGELNAGIAYTYTTPCTGGRGLDGPQEILLDTRSVPAGQQTIRLIVRDTAGNEATTDLQVNVDNEAPAAPVAVTDEAWSNAAESAWTWGASAEADRAPIVAADVEVCAPDKECTTETYGGSTTSYARSATAGSTTIRVRLRDAAGNVGAWSDPSVSRRDLTPPEVSISAPAQVAAGDPVEPWVTASDALSGVAVMERQVRVDGGAWQPLAESAVVAEGSAIRFRARSVDRAGNGSDWRESADVRVVPRTLAPVTPVAAIATPDPAPVLPPPSRASTKLTTVRATFAKRRLVVAGRVQPATATGRLRIRVGRRNHHARIRNGRFVLRVRAIRRPPARLALRYLGDARHRPGTRTVTVRRRR